MSIIAIEESLRHSKFKLNQLIQIVMFLQGYLEFLKRILFIYLLFPEKESVNLPEIVPKIHLVALSPKTYATYIIETYFKIFSHHQTFDSVIRIVIQC